jgi:hypothetical protein
MQSASDEGGSMAQITLNEGLAWLKTLKKCHEELLALRNDNAHRERRFYGASADKEIVKEPVYDHLVGLSAHEKHNQTTWSFKRTPRSLSLVGS